MKSYKVAKQPFQAVPLVLAALIAVSPLLDEAAFANNSYAPRSRKDSRQPRYIPACGDKELLPGNTMLPQNVPDFANPATLNEMAKSGQLPPTLNGNTAPGRGTALKADLASTTIPTQTKLSLVLETAVDAKTSNPGDIFEAHAKDDMYLGMTLLLPRGSMVRGRIAEVVKPRLLSRAGKIGLRLEQIVTPSGDVIPLDASLEFKKGTSNKFGQLDPGTSFGTKVEDNVKSVAGINKDGTTNSALVAANIATLGAPVVATAIGSSAIALFSQGDNVSLSPGAEIEIMLTNDLGLQIN